jgi:hypothetical protein
MFLLYSKDKHARKIRTKRTERKQINKKESYISGTGSSAGIKRPQRGFNHPTPFGREVKERVELYLWAFIT